jgi:succinate dehydrogenase / fumarate reductase, cytochrome b subunit
MQQLLKRIFGSSLGKKYIMAVSGCLLFLFVIAHLLGNLQIFLGPEVINRYGHFLQTNPELIWPARVGLLLMVGLHIWSAVKLTIENRAARPVGYAHYKVVAASYASRTMFMSGLIIFVFIVYHLLHFTVQVAPINLTGQNFVLFEDLQHRHDVFKMMVVGFSSIWVSGFYVLGMALLCLHLSHGVSSMFQSIGWKNKTFGPFLDKFARFAAFVIFLGYASIPLAVLFGYGKEALK